MNDLKNKPDDYWRQRLTEEAYAVCRKKGTERPFSGEYYNDRAPGLYRCTCCGEPLFDAETQFDAGCGWPSFYAPVQPDNVEEALDYSHSMVRTEITCVHCGSHLGHVFEDGPQPTGLRYCINSVSLKKERPKTGA